MDNERESIWKATRDELPDDFVDLSHQEQGTMLEEFVYVRFLERKELRDAPEYCDFTGDPFLKYQWISRFLRETGLTDSVRPMMREIDLVKGVTLRQYRLSRYEATLYFLPANVDGASNREIFGFRIWDREGSFQCWEIVKEGDAWVRRPSDYLVTCQKMGIAPYYSS